MIDYALVCLCLVGFAIFMYVILDGFDLGVGILFPCFSEKEQLFALKTIAPMWDGNETWLILGGAILLAGFPEAYSIILPAMYIPLMLMLCALVVRGVAFEFRAKAITTKALWGRAFFLASLVATLCQGIILGAYIQVAHHQIDLLSDQFVWATPFSVLCGVGLCFGYALLGAGWVVAKTEGSLQKKARALAINLYIAIFVVLLGISVLTPILVPQVAIRWFEQAWFYLAPLPVISLAFLCYALYKTIQGCDYWAFWGGVFIFTGCFIGLGYSIYPNLLPGRSYVELSAHISALKLSVWVSAILLPLLIGYTGYAYWVFRGKVSTSEQFYH